MHDKGLIHLKLYFIIKVRNSELTIVNYDNPEGPKSFLLHFRDGYKLIELFCTFWPLNHPKLVR